MGKINIQDMIFNLEGLLDFQDCDCYYDIQKNRCFLTDEFTINQFGFEDIEDIAYNDRYIHVADSYSITSSKIKQRFIYTLPKKQMEEFDQAFNGRGKYQRFKQLLNRYHLWDDYNEFETQYLFRYAIEWCKGNGLEYIDDSSQVVLLKEDDFEEYAKLAIEVYEYHQSFDPEGFPGSYIADKESYIQNLQDPNYLVIGYKAKQLLGYALVEIIERKNNKIVYYIHQIGVTKKSRSSGIGTKIYNYIKEEAKKNHATSVELSTYAFNQNAIDFYTKLGMKPKKLIMEEKI